MEEGSSSVEMAGAVIAFKLKEASSWWQDINESPVWQDRIFHVLAGLYGLVAAVALIQLIRIQLRVPEYGWTTQKVFHFLNFLVNGVRCLVFVFRRNIEGIHPPIFQHILLDFPSLAFFTTYALLVLFWAEIYYQARAVSTDGLRTSFFTINAVAYVIQCESDAICVLSHLLSFFTSLHPLEEGQGSAHKLVLYDSSHGSVFHEVVRDKVLVTWGHFKSFMRMPVVAHMLFLMLQRFPVESKGRRKKLQELSAYMRRGMLAAVTLTAASDTPRTMCFDAFDEAADLDVLDHPVLNFIYYLLVEILPSSLVLFILRKLPPKRGITKYHPIR
ncbi:unnamed protein product [Dovyalis caffra]|uniref:THH1/TOM1/TOM3 domain-containing protein n=1 Tax=Dovyalis caffra TaxID=77055 RepID=A0AAV1R0M4_9ROSI|nr:unnamed protein product [Dovyalis caffra]